MSMLILCMTHAVFCNIFLFYKIDNHFQVQWRKKANLLFYNHN